MLLHTEPSWNLPETALHLETIYLLAVRAKMRMTMSQGYQILRLLLAEFLSF